MSAKVATHDRVAATAQIGALIAGHETSFIAHLLSGRVPCDRYLHRVSSEVLSVPSHRIIVDAIRDLYDEREEINHVTVSNRLAEKGKLAECGGAPSVIDIALATTGEEIAESALDCMLENWRAREEAKIGKQLVAREIDGDKAREQLETLKAHARSDDLSIRTPDQILAMPRDPHSCLLGDRQLAKGQSLGMVGIGGIGKTRLLLQLLIAFIIGRFWCSLETDARGSTCMMLQTENSNHRLQTDLEALKKWAGKDWKLVEEKLKIHTLETDNDSLLHLSEPANATRLELVIRKINPDILSFDPLRDFGIGDLNSDADMSATLRELGRIARVGNPNRALVLLHHAITGRAGAAKAFGLERTGFARNSKVLHTWARGMINVVPGAEDNNETLILTCGKNSNGREFAPVAVRLTSAMIYEVADDFDVESWREKVCRNSTRRTFSPKIVAEIPWPQAELDKKQLAKVIMDEVGCGKSRAYSLIDEAARSRRFLRFNKTTRTYAKT